MAQDAPLLLPEINAEHIQLVKQQRKNKGWSGCIVTNPNCSTVVLAMALAPLRLFDIRRVIVSTMQAVSGAGYPGVPSLDILGKFALNGHIDPDLFDIFVRRKVYLAFEKRIRLRLGGESLSYPPHICLKRPPKEETA